MQKRQVLVINTVSLNGGDAAILYSLIAAIREAYGEDAEVNICDSQPQVARRLHQARLEEIPRKLEEAFERKRAQDAARQAWLADQERFGAAAPAAPE